MLKVDTEISEDIFKESSDLESNPTMTEGVESNKKQKKTSDVSKLTIVAIVLGVFFSVFFIIILLCLLFGMGSKPILQCPLEIRTVDFIEGDKKVEYLQVMRQIIENDKTCGFDYSSEKFQKFNMSIYNSFQLDVDARTVNKYFPFQSEDKESKNSMLVTQFTRKGIISFLDTWPHLSERTTLKEIKKTFFE